MDLKKLKLTDRVIFILGLTLAGVVAFVLVAGVSIALLNMYLDLKRKRGKGGTVTIRGDAGARTDAEDNADPTDLPEQARLEAADRERHS
ncbi:hypothetical protein [Paenibacillus sp. PL2-23]|uniref:hypothetical protein n=1 Tax=Paenibacillus sp. PL2-23 TaxID=2100729 RepID=UPI0030F4E57C